MTRRWRGAASIGNGTGKGTGSGTGNGTVPALQAALAAENAAIYGCGVVGAHLSGSQLAAITQAWNAHRARRDQLEAMLRDRGAEPAAALPVYRLPQSVTGPGDAVSLALLIEDRVTAVYLGVVALPDAALRTFAALAMQDAAVRAMTWRGRTIAFPGLPPSAITSPSAGNATGAAGTAAAQMVAPASASSARAQESPTRQAGEPGARSGLVPGEKQAPGKKVPGKGPHGKSR